MGISQSSVVKQRGISHQSYRKLKDRMSKYGNNSISASLNPKIRSLNQLQVNFGKLYRNTLQYYLDKTSQINFLTILSSLKHAFRTVNTSVTILP